MVFQSHDVFSFFLNILDQSSFFFERLVLLYFSLQFRSHFFLKGHNFQLHSLLFQIFQTLKVVFLHSLCKLQFLKINSSRILKRINLRFSFTLRQSINARSFLLRLVDNGHRLFFGFVVWTDSFNMKMPLWIFLDVVSNLFNRIFKILIDYLNFNVGCPLSMFRCFVGSDSSWFLWEV